MMPYYKQSLPSKRIILAFSSFLIFASSISLANAQKNSNSTDIDTLLDSADTLFNKKKYNESIPYYDKILGIKCIRDECSKSQRYFSVGVAQI